MILLTLGLKSEGRQPGHCLGTLIYTFYFRFSQHFLCAWHHCWHQGERRPICGFLPDTRILSASASFPRALFRFSPLCVRGQAPLSPAPPVRSPAVSAAWVAPWGLSFLTHHGFRVHILQTLPAPGYHGPNHPFCNLGLLQVLKN